LSFVVFEGLWSNTPLPFLFMRRRVDIKDAPWESHDYLFVDETEEASENLFYYYNSFFSSDGFFPQSFKSMEHGSDQSFRIRRQTRKTMRDFVRSLNFGTNNKLSSKISFYDKYGKATRRLPDSTSLFNPRLPSFFHDLYHQDMRDDFDAIGITLTSGSAEDASSYEYEMRYPHFTPKKKNLKITDKNTFEQVSPLFRIPEKIDYSLENLAHKDIYPLNIPTVSFKRNWMHDNPATLLFRDINKKYINLIRVPILMSNLDIKVPLLLPEYFRFGYLIRHFGHSNKHFYNIENLTINNLTIFSLTEKLILKIFL
jgi:hypothetical protein